MRPREHYVQQLEALHTEIRALGQMPSDSPKTGVAAGARAEAYAALVALGYKPVEVNRLLQSVEKDGGATEELIRRALQAAAR